MNRSPFKFLDAYQREDRDIFFGRDEEIDSLYRMSFQSKLLLVYGMSGTGKTSLIQCGLANCFDTSDWFEIFIRRKGDINASLVRELKARDHNEAFEEDFEVLDMIKSLYLDYLRPIYLIFDQFEEVFILGSEEEKKKFVDTVGELVQSDLPCKILIVVREEYLGPLTDFEKYLPKLFEKRLRVEPMDRTNAKKVILGTASSNKFNIQLADEGVADMVIDQVTEGFGRVQLPYLQVFLDKMYRKASQERNNGVVFDRQLVREVGRIDDVLNNFLDEQIERFVEQVDTEENALKFLKQFVSEKATKITVARHEIIERLPELGETRINQFIDFFVNRRILRPLDNDQYELAHDSLAGKIFRTPTIGVSMPNELPEADLPNKPYVRFEPYTEEMARLFFGRSEEAKELFQKVVNETQIRTTLVFGPLGVGKTSLIRAGFIPRVQQLFPVQCVRMSKEWLARPEVQELLGAAPEPGQAPKFSRQVFTEINEAFHRDERRILILDQFEELFIWEDNPARERNFFYHLGEMLRSPLNCDLIIVVRDEFFSQLQELEAVIPGILNEQMRVKHIDREAATEIILQTAHHAGLEIDDHRVIDRIIESVSDEEGHINLTYLQLYMDRLYEQI